MRNILIELSNQGCYPCISRRGQRLWRAHVNAAGNWWEDDSDPQKALEKAVKKWTKAGRPIDGEGSVAKSS